MSLHKGRPLRAGLNMIINSKETPKAQMDFSVLLLNKDNYIKIDNKSENAILLLQGKASIKWGKRKEQIERKSCFKDNPTMLLIPGSQFAEILSLEDNTRFAVVTTANQKDFEPVFLKPEDTKSENRGEGTLNECSTRIVRTLSSRKNCPQSNFFMGEVVNYPGKWSSFPPHSHVHPEIYYYNFLPSKNGYGISQDGDLAHVVHEGDAMLATDGNIHPQVTAPGYAMFYVWVIRDSDEIPHVIPGPVEEHAWTIAPGAKFFPDI